MLQNDQPTTKISAKDKGERRGRGRLGTRPLPLLPAHVALLQQASLGLASHAHGRGARGGLTVNHWSGLCSWPERYTYQSKSQGWTQIQRVAKMFFFIGEATKPHGEMQRRQRSGE